MLREEAASVCRDTELSSLEALARLAKMDSFFRESCRVYPIGTGESVFALRSQDSHSPKVGSARKLLQAPSFSGGVDLSKGTTVIILGGPIHVDKEYYPKPDVLDPLRFRHCESEKGLKYTDASLKYLSWGCGHELW